MLIALGAWVFTQFHLILAVRRIKDDIDTKRTATEAFVDERLGKVETLVGGFEGRMTAQMPPNVHGEIESVREEIAEINVGLRKEFEALPGRIKAQYMQERAIQAQHINAASSEMGAELEARLQAAVPEGYDDAASALERQMIDFIRKPIDPKLEKKDPSAAMVQRFAKWGMARFMEGRDPSGSSVTYRVSNKSPYGL